jgi:hypothetical protein
MVLSRRLHNNLMACFRSKTIQGVNYVLEHLDPFSFEVSTGTHARKVAVRFSCHCFTERMGAHHTPDFRYDHDGEIRAFDRNRYALSLLLPQMIAMLHTRSVYRSQQANYFVLQQNPMTGFDGPYLVFFNVAKAKHKLSDVFMNIESAYMKPNMIDRAAPIKFLTLVEKIATGQPIPRGPSQIIKRK